MSLPFIYEEMGTEGSSQQLSNNTAHSTPAREMQISQGPVNKSPPPQNIHSIPNKTSKPLKIVKVPLQTDESGNTPKTFTNSSLHCCSVHSKVSFCRNLVSYPHWFVLFPCVNQCCHFFMSSYNFAKINNFFILALFKEKRLGFCLVAPQNERFMQKDAV